MNLKIARDGWLLRFLGLFKKLILFSNIPLNVFCSGKDVHSFSDFFNKTIGKKYLVNYVNKSIDVYSQNNFDEVNLQYIGILAVQS